MEEWLGPICICVIAALIVVVESLRFGPNSLSQTELERRAVKGEADAVAELNKRTLLPLYFGLQRIKVTLLVVTLLGILFGTYEFWTAFVVGLVILLFIGVVVSLGWLAQLVAPLAKVIEPHLWKLLPSLAPILGVFAPRGSAGGNVQVSSKDELRQIIEQDAQALSDTEKVKLLSALSFGGKKVADAMVPRAKIVTVDTNETVGPLFLNKLHKAGHNVFVVVKKDLDAIQGLLYMSDLVPLDEDIKKVEDAFRPTVYYIASSTSLADALGASLKTGRQMFLAVDKQGKVVGLITLADVLEHAFGARLNKDATVATDPKKLTQ